MASVSRHQLLQKVNDSLRHLALPTRVHRSKTSLDPTKKMQHVSARKRRMSHAPLSQSHLTKIGEEDQDGELLLQTTTLPKKMSQLTLENRPVTLKWKGKAVSKFYQPPLVTHSKQPTSSPSETEEVSETIFRRPLKKAHRPKMLSLSDNRSRSPKLGVVGKSWSSGFNADTEDDVILPSDNSLFAATNPVPHDEEFFSNIASLSEDDSPTSLPSHDQHTALRLDDESKQTVQVTVEMHGDDVTNHTPLCALTSTDSTSSATVLLSPDLEENDVIVNSAHTQSLPTSAHLNAKQGRTRRVSFSNEVSVGGLNNALREASKYMYNNLDSRN